MKRILLSVVALTALTAGTIAKPVGSIHQLSFKEDRELVYEFRATLDQEIRTPGLPDEASGMSLQGFVSQFVVDIRNNDGSALLGQHGTGALQVYEGLDDSLQLTRDQAWLSAFRVRRDAAALERKSRHTALFERFRREGVSRVGDASQICAAFPAKPIKQGDEWKGEVLLPMPWGRQPADAVSRLDRSYEKDGESFSVIKTEFVCNRVAAPGYRWNVVTPHLHITGSTQGHFNIGRGEWSKMSWDITTELTGRGQAGFEGEIRVTSSARLIDARRFDGTAADEARSACRVLDKALAELHENRIDRGLEILGKHVENHAAEGVNLALGMTLELLKPLTEEEPKENPFAVKEPENEGRDVKLIVEAEELAARGQWRDAAALYIFVTEKFPESPHSVEALASAAAIYETELDRAEEARSLRERMLAICEREADGSPSPETFTRLASVYELSGNIRGALTAYRKALEYPEKEFNSGPRIMAQFKLARTLQSLGETAPAVKAYAAVQAIQAQDPYSRNLKAEAIRRMKELANENAE